MFTIRGVRLDRVLDTFSKLLLAFSGREVHVQKFDVILRLPTSSRLSLHHYSSNPLTNLGKIDCDVK